MFHSEVLETLHLCLKTFAILALSLNQFERAATLYGAAERYSDCDSKSFRKLRRRDIDILRTELEEKRFTGLWAAGRGMTLEQTMEYALEDAFRD